MGPDVAGVSCDKLFAAKISQSKGKVGGDIEEGCSRVEGKLKPSKTLISPRLGAGCRVNISRRKLALARNGICATRSANCNPLSSHHLHRSNDKMKPQKFLSLPKFHCRGRSQPRNEIGTTEGLDGTDPVAPLPQNQPQILGSPCERFTC